MSRRRTPNNANAAAHRVPVAPGRRCVVELDHAHSDFAVVVRETAKGWLVRTESGSVLDVPKSKVHCLSQYGARRRRLPPNEVAQAYAGPQFSDVARPRSARVGNPDAKRMARELQRFARSLGLKGHVLYHDDPHQGGFYYTPPGNEKVFYDSNFLGEAAEASATRLRRYGPTLDYRTQNPGVGRIVSHTNPDDTGRMVVYTKVADEPPKSRVLTQLYKSGRQNATADVTWQNRATVVKTKAGLRDRPQGFYHGNKFIGKDYREAATALGLNPADVDRVIRNEVRKARRLDRSDMAQLSQINGFEADFQITEEDRAALQSSRELGGRSRSRGLLGVGPDATEQPSRQAKKAKPTSQKLSNSEALSVLAFRKGKGSTVTWVPESREFLLDGVRIARNVKGALKYLGATKAQLNKIKRDGAQMDLF